MMATYVLYVLVILIEIILKRTENERNDRHVLMEQCLKKMDDK